MNKNFSDLIQEILNESEIESENSRDYRSLN